MPSIKSQLTKFVTRISPFLKNKVSLIYSSFRNSSTIKTQNTKQKTTITLTYRGIKYEYNPTIVGIEISEREKEGKYRGITWRVPARKQTFRLEPKNNLVYRGKSYQSFQLILIDQPSSTDKNRIETTNKIEHQELEKESTYPINKQYFSQQKQNYTSSETGFSSNSKIDYYPIAEPITIWVLDRDIFKNQLIDSGGEGEVWTTDKDGYLIKIYHQDTPEQIKKLEERIKKLEVMVAYQPKNYDVYQQAWAWPKYLLEDQQGEIIGFVMPFIEGRKKLHNIYVPKSRKEINFQSDWSVDWRFLHITAKNIATIIQSLHSQNYVVGDMKPENILVNKWASASIIDTDSFQVYHPRTKEVYHCSVGSEGFTPPELLEKELAEIVQTPYHDNFRLAVIIYHLLFGEHPFNGKWIGTEDEPGLDERIRLGFWPHTPNSQMQVGQRQRLIPLKIVHPEVQECFHRCFNDGHNNPALRPTAQTWVNVLKIAIDDLIQCQKVPSHWYSKTYGRCHWCDIKNKSNRDFFPDYKADKKRYEKLLKLLEEQKWKEADLETKYMMLDVAGRMNEGWLDKSSLENFPIEVLIRIDQLWRDYSSGRFGFTIQKNIYLETANNLERFNWETYNNFGEQVGWREGGTWKNYLDLEFSLHAPEGHLPFCCAGFDICVIADLARRLEQGD